MEFEIITIFPKIFESYFSHSIIFRAQKKGLISINIHNLRDWTDDKHKTVDDTPYGGGPGMVMKVEPIWKCVQEIINKKDHGRKSRIILFSAKGKRFTQKDAKRLCKFEKLVFICGRYEGVDERVAKYIADEEVSIGDFVLTGGEIPAMVLTDAIARHVPGVLGNLESSKNESHCRAGYAEFPQYTKPEKFLNWKVPEILLSGNHQKIFDWRKSKSQP
jgi:tRNA (guanine37-N1)-methyltransferase